MPQISLENLSPKDWLPTGKLSNTQIELVLRDPQEYYDRYFLGIKPEEPDHLKVGKIFHSIPLDPDWREEMKSQGVQAYIKTCEKYAEYTELPNQEEEITAVYDSKFGPVELIAYLDGHEPDIIYDLKTSPYRIWDRKKLQESGQFKLYSLLYYAIFGIIPEVRIRSFKLPQDPAKSRMAVLAHTHKLRDILAVQQKIEQALEIIHELYVEQNKSQS